MAEMNEAITGNAAKMREALEFLIKHKEWLRGYNLTMTLEDLEMVDRILGKAEAALAEPPRNCDVGTAEEQFKRYLAFCHCESRGCQHCPANKTRVRGTSNCDLAWAQMPYKKGGAK